MSKVTLNKTLLMSRPIKVWWRGFSSTTLELQRFGWSLAVDFDAHRQEYTLLIKNKEMNLYAISNHLGLPFDLITDPHRIADHENLVRAFEIRHVANSIQVQHLSLNGSNAFSDAIAINAEPKLMEHTVTRLEDLNIFRPLVTQSEEILIEQADMSVVELLQKIKDKQSDRQFDLRKKAKRAESEEVINIEAPQRSVVAHLSSYR